MMRSGLAELLVFLRELLTPFPLSLVEIEAYF